MNEQHESTNVALLRGPLVADPAPRDLPSGSVVVQFDIATTVSTAGRATRMTVPVAWTDPPAKALEPLVAGTDVVVVGRVQRRFFRVGGATQSRTEVVAEAVVPARRAKQVRTLLAATATRLGL